MKAQQTKPQKLDLFNRNKHRFMETIKQNDKRTAVWLENNWDSIKFVDDPIKSTYFYGPVGTGKTIRAAVLMLNHVRNMYLNGYSPFPSNYHFVSVEKIFEKVKNSYKAGFEETEVLDEFGICKILVLDEIPTIKLTEWEYKILYQIIRSRYSNMLTTIYTCNFSLEALSDKFNDLRAVDRIRQDCEERVYKIDGESKRGLKND